MTLQKQLEQAEVGYRKADASAKKARDYLLKTKSYAGLCKAMPAWGRALANEIKARAEVVRIQALIAQEKRACATPKMVRSHPDGLMAAAPKLLAYAKCEEARSRGEDIAETVLRQHGWLPAKGTSHDFMDQMRRAAIAKAEREQA